MLWLNLIMDVLGAIALCTEPWAQGLNLPRVSRTKSLLLPEFWKLIFVQAAYQVVVILILMFFYGMMRFDSPPDLFTDPLRDKNGNATNRLKMDTFVFHTFVLMCLFNQFNCRNIDSKNLNPFSNLQNHLFFILVWGIEVAIQQSMVMYGTDKLSVTAALLGTAHLEVEEHVIAYVLGAFTIVVGVASKKIPDTAFEWTKSIGLERSDDNDVLSKWHGIFRKRLTIAQQLAVDPTALTAGGPAVNPEVDAENLDDEAPAADE